MKAKPEGSPEFDPAKAEPEASPESDSKLPRGQPRPFKSVPGNGRCRTGGIWHQPMPPRDWCGRSQAADPEAVTRHERSLASSPAFVLQRPSLPRQRDPRAAKVVRWKACRVAAEQLLRDIYERCVTPEHTVQVYYDDQVAEAAARGSVDSLRIRPSIDSAVEASHAASWPTASPADSFANGFGSLTQGASKDTSYLTHGTEPLFRGHPPAPTRPRGSASCARAPPWSCGRRRRWRRWTGPTPSSR